MKNVVCPGCGSAESNELYDMTNPTAHSDVGLKGLIRKCRNCGLIYKSYKLDPEDLYNDDYADKFVDIKAYQSYSAVKLFSSILKKSKNRTALEKKKLLDIGSGVGTMLDTARSLGFQTTGVEVSGKLASIARGKGHEIITQNVTDIYSECEYEVISMMDIIEHLQDPKVILFNLKKLLKPGGELIVYTPNHDSLIVKIAGALYKAGLRRATENIFACTHTVFFTTKTLQAILINTGYEIIATDHFEYDIYRSGQKISLVSKIGVSLIEKLGKILGYKGFRVVMYARKSSL